MVCLDCYLVYFGAITSQQLQGSHVTELYILLRELHCAAVRWKILVSQSEVVVVVLLLE